MDGRKAQEALLALEDDYLGTVLAHVFVDAALRESASEDNNRRAHDIPPQEADRRTKVGHVDCAELFAWHRDLLRNVTANEDTAVEASQEKP